MENLEQQNFQTYSRPSRIGWGADGEVYRISDKHAAKISTDGRGNIRYECNIARALFEKGISVPKPEGVFPVMIPQLSPFEINGFIMGFVDGKTQNLNEEEKDYINMIHKEEVGKAIDIGFSPGHDVYNNTNHLWDSKENKVYLIDFARWMNKIK